MKRADIFEFYRRLAELNPSPETELEFGNIYQLLVAVVLSAQATDVGVNKATRLLFQDVKTPQQMIDLGEDGLGQLHRRGEIAAHDDPRLDGPAVTDDTGDFFERDDLHEPHFATPHPRGCWRG